MYRSSEPTLLKAAELALDARAPATRKAYAGDLRRFKAWCRQESRGGLPASPEVVADYLAHLASTGRSAATIRRALSAINSAHRVQGLPVPGNEGFVRDVSHGIARRLGTEPERAKPLSVHDLRKMVGGLGDDLAGVRDRALLLLGFAGALRRSEMVALDVGDIEFVAEGIRLHIRASKTDQEGKGTVLGVPHGARAETCPVRAVEAWVERVKEGPLFRAVDRHGNLSESRMADYSVVRIVRRAARAAGLSADSFRGHSLRAGMITEAAKAGVPEGDIARQSRHRSVQVLRDYVRLASVFQRNPVAGLL